MTMRTKYDSRLTVLCPAELLAAIATGSAAKMQRPSEYVRAGMVAWLQADGIAIGAPQPGDGDDVMSVRTFHD